MNQDEVCDKLTDEFIKESDLSVLYWDNLRQKFMMAYAAGFKEGRKKTGGYNQRKIIQKNLIDQPIKLFDSAREAGRETGINYTHILHVCQKKPSRKTAGGFKWEYANENNQ